MLQRKQSIFIILTIIVGIIMLFSPLYFYSVGGSGYIFKCFSVIQMGAENAPIDLNVLLLGIVSSFAVLQSVVALFLYKKIKLQKNMIQFNMLTWVVVLTCIIYYSSVIESHLANTMNLAGINSKPDIGTFLPIVAYILLFIANKGVKKDEELLKSADRIR